MWRGIGLLLLTGACNDAVVAHVTDPPVAAILSPLEGALTDAQLTRFEGLASDMLEPPGWLLAGWEIEDGAGWREICPPTPPDDAYISVCEAPLIPGDQAVRLTVTDRFGERASDVVTFVAEERFAPTVVWHGPVQEARYASDVPITLDLQVADEDDDVDALLLSVESDLEGPLMALPVGPSGQAVGDVLLESGTHLLTATVVDERGGTGTAEVRVTVGGPNQAPTCTINAPLSGWETGVPRSVSATVLDAETPPEELEAQLCCDVAGDPWPQTGPDGLGYVQAEVTPTTGVQEVVLTVLDEWGAGCETSFVVSASARPLVHILEPTDGATWPAGTPVTVSAEVADDLTPLMELEVTWSRVGHGVLGTTSPDALGIASLTFPGLPAGSHLLEASVTDSEDLASTATVAVQVE